MVMIDQPSQASVKLEQPSYYHSPPAGGLKDKLTRLHKSLAYKVYRKRIFQSLRKNDSLASCNILEIGCGPGYLSSFLESWFPTANITAFEYDVRLIEEAKTRTQNVSFVQGNAESLELEENTFDVVISLHLIEHLYNPELMIGEVSKVLKPGGLFILATPNPEGLGAKWMGDKWQGLRDDHVSLRSPSAWSQSLHESGLSAVLEHTTLLSGIPLFTKTPLAIANLSLLLLFGSFPWKRGEAYVSSWTKP